MQIIMLSPDAQMIDRRILQEASSLQRNGHHVTVLSGFECAQPDAYEQPDGVVVKRYAFDWTDLRKVRTLKRWGRLGRFVWPFQRVAAKVFGTLTAYETFVVDKALEHEFDVVHVHDFPMLKVAATVAQLRRVPLIYDSHEFYPVQSCFTPQQQRKFLALERALIKRCRRVITVNPYIARMIAKEHDVTEPMVILNASPLPADDQRDVAISPDARRAAREKYGLPKDAFIFVYQGWISAERNLEAMLHAFRDVAAPAMLLVIGYGEHVKVLQALADKLELNDRVIFYGRVESDQLADLTELCDVGVIPYAAVDEMHRYCSPNKLFEFVAARLPIIASDLPYLRDVVDGYKIGWLCDTTAPDVLARTMTEALTDSQAINTAQHNLLNARSNLNWSVEERKLLELYTELGRNPGAQLQPSRKQPPNMALIHNDTLDD
ncbi:glycosyltransferase family 4 protein [Paraburkholderia sp. GAS334]|uniref:glycosyltransferase family 4 protein n=1 Tax=Paraburkholderia sp. GAS334 TaxID=3035131 RepID=UPI003D1FF2A9